jgi:hypothetical protein
MISAHLYDLIYDHEILQSSRDDIAITSLSAYKID